MGKKRKAENVVEVNDLPASKKSKIHLPTKPEEVSSNWKQLLKSGKVVYKKKAQKKTMSKEAEKGTKDKVTKKVDEILLERVEAEKPVPSNDEDASSHLVKPNSFSGLTKVVAMDCEMVGFGSDGRDDMLARVSIVNHFGQCVYDKYAKPTEKVTDYRTFVSGIRPSDLINAEDFKTVQKEVSDILDGRIVVGHALHHDFKVLFLTHPKKKLRDTSRYKPFRSLFSGGLPSLKKLSEKLLGVRIQDGEHSSVQDAQAAMRLYTMHRQKWESSLKKLKKKDAKS